MVAVIWDFSGWHHDPNNHLPTILLNCGATAEFDICFKKEISTITLGHRSGPYLMPR
jgi:hypothetical protein